MNVKISKSWLFFGTMVLIYLAIAFFDYLNFLNSLKFVFNTFSNVLPVLVLVFCLMAATNYFITPMKVVKHLGGKPKKRGWLLMIFGGILSTGPIYMWYPLLNDLQKKGVKDGLIATFLYNRAIKLPLLPLIIVYFGLKYAIILTLVMIVLSIFQIGRAHV